MSTARTIPVWELPPAVAAIPFDPVPPQGPLDVVVIGAGIAGLTTALCLLREGRQVLVLDREGVGAGETLRTTAHLASALDDRYYDLERRHGHDGARLAAASHAAAVDWIEELAMSAPGGCGFRRVPGYLFAHDGDASRLRREHQAAQRAGLKTELLADGATPLPALGSVLRFDDQARVDPGAYMARLAGEVQRRGGRFHRAHVTAVESGDMPVLTLGSGRTLQAASVVVATNVPFHSPVAIHTKQAPYRTYVVAGRVPRGSVPDALVWDDGDPYHYIRLHPLPDVDEDLLIVGGEDHKTGQQDDPTAYVRLQEWTRARFPAVREFTHAWSGQVLEPGDGLAFIGADPSGLAGVYIATGDSGNGMTHGTIAGLLICDLVQGRDNPWAALYDPRRKMVRSAGEWIRENANVALQYRDWLGTGEVRDASQLAPGQGAVVRRGLHRVAVFRSGDGALHAHSARCTHLGCAVRWSTTEKSWDCPCHGSRFDVKTGAVLNGPAREPLAPYDLGDDGGAHAQRRAGGVPE